jgi:hypothetical protein
MQVGEYERGVVMAKSRRMVLALSITMGAMGCSTSIDDQSTDGGGGGAAPGATGGRSAQAATGGSAGETSGTGGAQGGSGGSAGGAGACDCPAFDGDGEMPYTVTLSLDCFCQLFDCPASPDAMLTTVTARCPYQSPQVSTGCGVKAFSFGTLGGTSAYFDAQTGALLGMMKYDDVPWAACRAHVYQTGFEHDCPTAEVCTPCPDAGTNTQCP